MHLAKAGPCQLMFAETLHFTHSDPQERLESGHRCFPAVEAKDEFVKVGLQILWIDSMMSTIELRFEIAKSPVDVRSPHSWILPVPTSSFCIRKTALSTPHRPLQRWPNGRSQPSQHTP